MICVLLEAIQDVGLQDCFTVQPLIRSLVCSKMIIISPERILDPLLLAYSFWLSEHLEHPEPAEPPTWKGTEYDIYIDSNTTLYVDSKP